MRPTVCPASVVVGAMITVVGYQNLVCRGVKSCLDMSSCTLFRPLCIHRMPTCRCRRQSGGSGSGSATAQRSRPPLQICLHGLQYTLHTERDAAIHARLCASPMPRPSRSRPVARGISFHSDVDHGIGLRLPARWSCMRWSDWAQCRRPSARPCRP